MITVSTDGSCLRNPGGAIGWAWVDHEGGSWHHELDASNCPSGETWSGKPDVYHAIQAAFVPGLPVTPSFATALARG